MAVQFIVEILFHCAWIGRPRSARKSRAGARSAKAHRLAGFLLDPLDIRPLHFADPAAFDADQMVVMRPLVFNLELGPAARGGDAFGQPAFLEHFQRAEHRHYADAFSLERQIDLLHRDMLFGMEQEIHDLLALVVSLSP